MNVLVASAFPARVAPAFSNLDDAVHFVDDTAPAPTAAWIQERGIEAIVSFGYGHIWTSSLLAAVPIYNIHGSLLPWNRGPNPNLWSWIDDTPKGVTIHLADAGMDTGPILFQKELDLDGSTLTLKTSFDVLVEASAALFVESWPRLRAGDIESRPQLTASGSIRTFADQQPIMHILQRGLDWPLPRLLGEIRDHLRTDMR